MFAKAVGIAVVLLLAVIAVVGVALIVTVRNESLAIRQTINATTHDECGTRFTQPCEVRVVD